MKRITIALITTLVVFLAACGVDPTKQNEGSTTKQTEAEGSQLTNSDFVLFEGYVSPVNISVNGKAYRDSEDFYTQEVKRLKTEVAKSYPQHSLYFDADVGLRDFKLNLLVLLVATSDTGIASESSVDSKGKFTFNLPSDVDKQQTYTVRASKRIGLRLVKDQEVISWCYNLFAENDVTLESKSIILRKFETVITSYRCEEEDRSESIELPENPIKYVTEAFENADHYNGYGPRPKTATKPIVTPTPSPIPTPIVNEQEVVNTINNAN
jgi:hypothetical protein